MTLSRSTLAWAGLPLAFLLINTPAKAQDSHYAPRGGSQQFSAPDCFTVRGAWEGGAQPCTAKSFDDWLNDLTHWRAERHIRIGYDPRATPCPLSSGRSRASSSRR